MRGALAGLLLVAAVGCKSDPPEAPPPPRERPLGPDQPINLEKPDMTRVQLDLAQARGEIKKHMQLEGGLPPSLDVLGLKLRYPKDLTYDPKTGVVRSKTYPGM